MKRELLTGNGAAALAAKLSEADYIPAFPITPQTEIIESISEMIDSGEMNAKMVMLESEHSMITAAGSAAATGVRVFSATSSQGLLYAMEMLYTVAGWRVPFVLVNVSRGLSAPITLEPDHNDILAARDCGFLQMHCSTCQEVFDSILIAYRLAENSGVRLPVMVNMDGFYLSFTREPVEIPDAEAVKKFIGEYDPENIRFRAGHPVSQAVAVLGGSPYSYFRYELHLAARNALSVYREISEEFGELFGRRYDAVESYRTDDAEIVFVMMGSFATKARDAVDILRKSGKSAGLLRLKLFRPFPRDDFRKLLSGIKGAAVIDQNISMGMGGILHSEICAALHGFTDGPSIVMSYIGGLGGRDISKEDFFRMADETFESVKAGRAKEPRLLYTEQEMRQIRKLQSIAGMERHERGKSDER